jgi:hypothetical protein
MPIRRQLDWPSEPYVRLGLRGELHEQAAKKYGQSLFGKFYAWQKAAADVKRD